MCFSTEDYNKRMNKHYLSNNDDEKIIPKWFYLLYCDECEKFIEFVNNKCSEHLSHKALVTCNYCQNNFRTHCSSNERCSSCCRLIERKLKTYTFEKLKKLANVYNTKRRRDFIIDNLVQKVEDYNFIIRKHMTKFNWSMSF